MAVRCAHHGNLDTLIAQSSDTSGLFSFDRGPPFEIEAEFAKEIDRRCEIIDCPANPQALKPPIVRVEYIDSRGEDYVRQKARIVRSQPRATLPDCLRC